MLSFKHPAPCAAQRRAAPSRCGRAAVQPVLCQSRFATSSNKDGGSISKLPDALLYRAASSIEHRGTCTCLTCRGNGSKPCGACEATGHRPQQLRSNLVHSAFQQMRTLVGMSAHVAYADDGFLRTNRCLRCHGYGRVPCDSCSGSGLRYPHLTADDPRQCAGQPSGTECPLPLARSK